MRRSGLNIAAALTGAASLMLVDARGQQAPAPAAPEVPAGKIRIGAWNIENLGTKKRYQQTPENLADYILSSRVDMLALEEIHDDDQMKDEDEAKAPWKNKELDLLLPMLAKATGDEWQYELTGPGPDNVRCQMTGVLWRKSRLTLKGRELLKVKGGNHKGAVEEKDDGGESEKLTHWTRRPEAFLFSIADGKTDFAVVPVHMKSNRAGDGVSQAMRVEEATQLLAAMNGVFPKEADVVFLGDTNIKKGETSVQEVWKDHRDLNAAEAITWNGFFDKKKQFDPFDRIFVPKGQPEFSKSEQHVHFPSGADDSWVRFHRNLRSDHLLIWCDIDVMADDD